jgi:uncharacterized protein (TIGR02145 family)
MKKLFTIVVAVLLTATVWAQSPEKMSYQAVIRDASDNLVTSQAVGMQISILQGSASGTAVYVETQTPTSNANGLVSIEIGGGVGFDTINWANGPYFIKTETDPTGGTSYTITGTSQLLSVPYALHAKTADSLSSTITETDPVYGSSVASGITGADTTNWNNKLDSETDPSVPSGTQTGEMQCWDGTEWITVERGSTGQVLTFINGTPVWVGDTLTEDVVVNSVTGKIWMDKNLGASQVATSSTDADAYGDLYQWGRGTDGHEKRTSSTTATLSSTDTPGHGDFITNGSSPYDWRDPQNDNLWQGVNGTNNPCPSGYRLPTDAEWQAELDSWSSDDAAGAFASPLKLPVAGRRGYSDGSLNIVGSGGYYWSSTVGGANASYLSFYGSGADMFSNRRAVGFSVRCLKD